MNLSLTKNDYFICIDIQRLFLEPGDWYCPEGLSILPNCVSLAKASTDRCLFTRFITPHAPADAKGQWRDYYHHWQSVTQSVAGKEMMELHAQIQPLADPSQTFDKPTYDVFKNLSFVNTVQSSTARNLIIFGIETDVCVMASVLSAVDLGFCVVVVTDATASSDMRSHQVCLDLVYPRFDQQIILATTAEILDAWDDAPEVDVQR